MQNLSANTRKLCQGKLCGNDEEHSAPILRKQVKAKVQWLCSAAGKIAITHQYSHRPKSFL